MENGISCKSLEVSDEFMANLTGVYYYTFETFGILQADRYKEKIEKAVDTLPEYYTAYSECQQLATKSRMYRRIILDAHLIIYRITKKRIEVLDIVHHKSSNSRIQKVRSIRLS